MRKLDKCVQEMQDCADKIKKMVNEDSIDFEEIRDIVEHYFKTKEKWIEILKSLKHEKKVITDKFFYVVNRDDYCVQLTDIFNDICVTYNDFVEIIPFLIKNNEDFKELVVESLNNNEKYEDNSYIDEYDYVVDYYGDFYIGINYECYFDESDFEIIIPFLINKSKKFKELVERCL